MTSQKPTEFDSLCSSDETNILKILTFYLNHPLREIVILYIMLLEFENLLTKQRRGEYSKEKSDKEPHYFFEEIEPYCHTNPTLNQMFQFYTQIRNMKDMLGFIKDMQALSEDGSFPFSDLFNAQGIDMDALQGFADLFKNT